MTDEELRVRAIQELEFYKKDDTFMLADITVDLAIKALEQMPVTTTAGEGGVIYYPQVEGVTPTVVDAGKQEPSGDAVDRKLVCAFIGGLISDETERKKALQYINELPSVNPQPCQEKWIDEDDNRYICKECEYAHKPQKEPCEDAISRAEAIKMASGYCHPANVAKELAKLPAVTPQPKTGHWIRVTDKTGHLVWECDKCSWQQRFNTNFCPDCGAKMIEPQERSDKE